VPDAEYPTFAPGFGDGAMAMRQVAKRIHVPPESDWRGIKVCSAFERLPEATEAPEVYWNALLEFLWGGGDEGRFHLGGHANPIQSDHRFFFEECQRYDRCLLNFPELEGFDVPDMNFAILVANDDLHRRAFHDAILIADTD